MRIAFESSRSALRLITIVRVGRLAGVALVLWVIYVLIERWHEQHYQQSIATALAEFSAIEWHHLETELQDSESRNLITYS